MLLLLLLSHFSHVWFCATPQMAAQQALLSLGFSRQEHWNGLPFPSPMHESEKWSCSACPTLFDPTDCSLPGSSVHGIFQARVLEWVAIAFSQRPYTINANNLKFSMVYLWGTRAYKSGLQTTLYQGIDSRCFYFILRALKYHLFCFPN